jgi:hypothetical protein
MVIPAGGEVGAARYLKASGIAVGSPARVSQADTVRMMDYQGR